MATSVENCEDALADLLGRKYCILTGNGTSALWIAYSLVGQKRPKVLLPAMVCLTPMLATHYAGKTPVFADVLERDATLDPHFVETALQDDPGIGAVLAVHLYGHPVAMEVLDDICSKYGVLLIEDLAQAMGGKYANGVPFGAGGDCSVVSFGHTKILDVGGGGAFLTDNQAWARQAYTLAKQLAKPPTEIDKLYLLYRKLFYTVWECGQANPAFYKMFDPFPDLFRVMLLYGITEPIAAAIFNALDELDSEISHRKQIAALYRRELKNIDSIDFFDVSDASVPWRFTFRLAQRFRNDILEEVRLAEYDISSWYPSITDWTPSGRKQGRELFPVANTLEKQVVNLWVTKDYTEQKALSLTTMVKEILSKVSYSAG